MMVNLQHYRTYFDYTDSRLLLLTYAQSTAGAHGAARLSPVLGDGGDAD